VRICRAKITIEVFEMKQLKKSETFSGGKFEAAKAVSKMRKSDGRSRTRCRNFLVVKNVLEVTEEGEKILK
ncbi:hypothetical protein Tco_1491825, partial [Tanacetum coccineum]